MNVFSSPFLETHGQSHTGHQMSVAKMREEPGNSDLSLHGLHWNEKS
jgi:hypothetical protein